MPLQRSYANQECSVAATLELVGERWTLLIVRELLLGVHRFSELQADLGIARNVLQARLERLVERASSSAAATSSTRPATTTT